VFQHVGKHYRDMLIGGGIEHLLAVSLSLNDPCGAQESQVVADERITQVELPGDIIDGNGRVETRQHDPQTGRITEQVEQVGEFSYVAISGRGHYSS